MKLINNISGEEIEIGQRVHDTSGRLCLIEYLANRPDGRFVLISHHEAGAHLVPPETLNARIED